MALSKASRNLFVKAAAPGATGSPLARFLQAGPSLAAAKFPYKCNRFLRINLNGKYTVCYLQVPIYGLKLCPGIVLNLSMELSCMFANVNLLPPALPYDKESWAKSSEKQQTNGRKPGSGQSLLGPRRGGGGGGGDTFF
jgi:hypothetical protein